jgi:uncharacterized protein
MTTETFSLIISRLKEYAETRNLTNLTLLWHGGEPLMMGDEFYGSVEKLLKELPDRIRVRHLLQTNLTLFNPDKYPNLLRLLSGGQGISSSFDPVDGVRLLANGKSYRDYWLKAFFRLREKNITTSVVYVVHRESLGKAEQVYHFFSNLGVRGIRVNPMIESWSYETCQESGGFRLRAEDYGAFLRDLWDVWVGDQRRLTIEPFMSWSSRNKGERAMGGCDLGGDCASNLFCIDPEGNLYLCGRHLDQKQGLLGNLADDSLVSFQNQKELKRRSELLQKGHCKDCEWWSYCHGSCPMESYGSTGQANLATPMCAGYRKVLEHAFGSPEKQRSLNG